MRHSKYIMFFLITTLPLYLFAQETKPGETDITGLWKGTIYNDTTREFYRYEIGISEEKGKLSGFSHTWYNDSDKHYFAIKKVKVKRKDGKIIIEDVEVIAHNYPEKPPKGVRRLHILTLETRDSILILSGPFSTNQTKEYAPVTGSVELQHRNDFRKQSDLIPHLQELGMVDQLTFVAKQDELAKQEEEKILNKTSTPVSGTPVAPKEVGEPTAKTNQKKIVVNTPLAQQEEDKKLSKTSEPVSSVPATQKEISEPTAKTNQKKIVVNTPKIPAGTTAVATKAGPAADVMARKNVLQETMFFKTDSLVLTLYDNGEVDGDTVSVLMNGTIIMAKQGLSTTAIRKTIQIPAETDSIELVMYAESLGTISPNTGLLIVRDGRDSYEVRFSGDLQKNATVILKRRKN